MQLCRLWYFFAIGFGVGNIYWMPVGTVASLLAIPIWWILLYFFSYQIYYMFVIIGIGMGIYICDYANKIIGVHDHKSVVWDELVGMWITLTIVPMYSGFWIAVAFILFRMLDIIKPYPISWFDREINGGFGVMIDDICAGIISVSIIACLMNFFK